MAPDSSDIDHRADTAVVMLKLRIIQPLHHSLLMVHRLTPSLILRLLFICLAFTILHEFMRFVNRNISSCYLIIRF